MKYEDEILQAVINGNITDFRYYLEQNSSLSNATYRNAGNEEEQHSLLYIAALNGRKEMCEVLLQEKALSSLGKDPAIFGAILNGDKNIVNLFLPKDLGMRSKSKFQKPLEYAREIAFKTDSEEHKSILELLEYETRITTTPKTTPKTTPQKMGSDQHSRNSEHDSDDEKAPLLRTPSVSQLLGNNQKFI